MRTTIDIDEQLHKDLKAIAVKTNQTLTAVVEDALRHSLSQRRAAQQLERFEVPVVGRGGPRPGVDLSSWASLLDVMEGEDAPPGR